MSQVHSVLQGKGGIGKSVVAYLIAQYLESLKKPMVAIDIDPVNATLTSYKGLNVTRKNVIEDGEIIAGSFDEMMEEIISDDESNFVIDNGASSFVPFVRYLLKNDIIDILSESGKEVYVHTVIKAGQDLKITLAGFDSLAEQLPESARIIVWLNEFMGEIAFDGKRFEDMKVYKKNKDRVHGIIRVKPQSGTDYGADMKRMLGNWLTFDEAIASPAFGVIPRKRLQRVRKEIFDQLDSVINKEVEHA